MATNIVSDLKIFQVITTDIARIAGSAAPDQLFPATGVIDAVLSPENTSGLADISTEIMSLNGKDRPQHDSPAKPRFQVKFAKPFCDYSNTGTKPDICATVDASADPYGYLDVTVDKYASRQTKITVDQFNNLNETPNERLTYELIKMAKEIRVIINNDIAEDIVAQAGTYADGSSSVSATKELPLWNPTGAFYQPIALASIKQDYMQGGFNGTPIFVGGAKTPFMNIAGQAAGFGANSLNGNPASYNPVTVFGDMYLDGVLGNNKENAFTFMPGSVRLVEWFENEQYKAIDFQMQKAFVINIMGMRFDIDMVWSACGKYWTITLGKWYGLFTIPQTAYDGASNCRRNLILNYYMSCGVAGCDLLDTTSVIV